MADAQELASVAPAVPAVPSAVAPDADKPEAGASSSADDAPSTTADEAKADAPAAASEEGTCLIQHCLLRNALEISF